MKQLVRIFAAFLIAALAAVLFAPAQAQAQAPLLWRDRATAHFTILYDSASEAEAARYAGFVDTIYDEIAGLFRYRTATPLTLRLFPTSEDYYQLNPAARNVPGVVAHADFRRRELVVIIERTQGQDETQVQNNVRHELTHIVAADLSENRLNTGFQEGIAQYLEQPSADLEVKAAALRQTADQGRLLLWSDFDNRDAIYGAPDVSYPQTLSVVAFLVERSGFATFRDFLAISARSSGYRSALERAYGVSATTLEEEWRAWLPDYLAGGYRRSALQAYDLGFAANLIGQGAYAEAAAELREALEWLRRNSDTQPAGTIAEAEVLLARSEAGMRAEGILQSARDALEQADYARAAELIVAAEEAYRRLDDPRQADVLATYADRTARGLGANAQLNAADALAQQFRLPQARAAADAAASEFAALGDQNRLRSAVALRESLDLRQRLFGAALIVVGTVGVILSLIGSFFRRPAEVW
jgi:hypothetical protein